MGEMRYRRLGQSELMVSVVGLGCNNFGGRIDADATAAVVGAALDEGITLFDTSDSYGDGRSEEYLGAALKGRRDEAVIATKFGYDRPGAKGQDPRSYVPRAVEASLRRLGTDRIDLYQQHWPDEDTRVEDTLSILDDLVGAGKVRYIGHSNFAGWQAADAAWIARTRGQAAFVSAQNHYNLLHREPEAELVPACQHFGLGLLPYFPLASGLLTGKYRRGTPPPAGTRLAADRFAGRLRNAPWDTIDALAAFAAERGIGLLDVAIGWLAAQPSGAQPVVASVIAGATTPEQVRANVAAGGWQPTPDDLSAIDGLGPA
jgi:aryl-alcohol dehydrogenase-like predicted oxidoreductase